MLYGIGLETHVVEDEELGFRAEIGGVADPGRLEVGLGLLGDRARVAAVGLARRRLEHVADDRQRRGREERVHGGGLGIRHQRHVGFVDRLPAGDRGAVEHDAFREDLLVDHRHVEGDVLPLAARVGEPEVDIFDVIVLDRLQDVPGGLHVVQTFPVFTHVVLVAAGPARSHLRSVRSRRGRSRRCGCGSPPRC